MPRLVRPLLAIAAALTGSFSRQDVALNFLWVALGGIAVGAGITWIVGRIKLDQPTTALLEHFRRRPAGLTTGLVEGSRQPLSVVRIRRTIVWEVPQFAANGIIFVLLGEPSRRGRGVASWSIARDHIAYR